MTKTLLINEGYIYDEPIGIWSRPGYIGLPYSDGDEIEMRIAGIIDKATDVSVLSSELRQHCTDWTTTYHLAATRANIMRPFAKLLKGDVLEIGAGCGAITRYLGECGGTVVALEGSLRRASIARSRTRDLGNVYVLAEKFGEFKPQKLFDVVTLIGVLEYSNLFTEGPTPHASMLEQARCLLKPNGKLIIAIENQLGLKYFAGAPEDHFGEPMVGIEGRYGPRQPQTFGRKVLMEMVKRAGFNGIEFFAPFPDYKLPVSIVTESGFDNPDFDTAPFAWQSVRRDRQLPFYCNFSLELAWPEIHKNGLALDLANSFLIAATTGAERTVDKNILTFHYSTERIALYCKHTIFSQNNSGQIIINYQPLEQNTNFFVEEPNSLIKYVCPESDNYVKGHLLSLEFFNIVTRDNWNFEEVTGFLKRYLLAIGMFFNSESVIARATSPHIHLPGRAFDALPHNIVVNRTGEFVSIDNEWTVREPLTLGYILFRALFMMSVNITCFGRSSTIRSDATYIEFIKSAMESIGFKLEDSVYTMYLSQETEIQMQVTGVDVRKSIELVCFSTLPFFRLHNFSESQDGIVVQQGNRLLEQNRRINDLANQMTNLSHVIHVMENSLSWKVSIPLRFFHQLFFRKKSSK